MSLPRPDITEANRPYWDGLAEGRLRYQRCTACGHSWLPPRERCPACLAVGAAWHDAAGGARVVSWVVYHKAYAPHLDTKLPYDVTIVELDEGPRLLTNVVDSEAGQRLSVGVRVTLAIETEDGLALPRFRLGE